MRDDIIALASRNLLGVFNERDPQARAAVVEQIYTEDVTFADPEGVVVGRPALHAKAQHILDDAAGFVFRPDGPVRVVQNLAMMAWQFGPEGQEPVVRGQDVLIIEGGRIAELYTLLES